MTGDEQLRQAAQRGEIREVHRKLWIATGRGTFRLSELRASTGDESEVIFSMFFPGAVPGPETDRLASMFFPVFRKCDGEAFIAEIERGCGGLGSLGWCFNFDRFATQPWGIMLQVLDAPSRFFRERPDAVLGEALAKWICEWECAEPMALGWVDYVIPALAHEDWLCRIGDRMAAWADRGWELLIILYGQDPDASVRSWNYELPPPAMRKLSLGVGSPSAMGSARAACCPDLAEARRTSRMGP